MNNDGTFKDKTLLAGSKSSNQNKVSVYQPFWVPTDELVVAEALYFRANLLNIEGKYDLSNDVISQISISTNQSSVWNAKSLLLLAKNYLLC